MAVSFAALAALIVVFLMARSEIHADHLYWLVGGFFALAFLSQQLP